MINPNQLIEHIIEPVITKLKFDTNNVKGAVALILYTAKQESECGEYIAQLGNGPARSFLQIEKPTYDDCFTNWLDNLPKTRDVVLSIAGANEKPDYSYVVGNMFLSTAIARCQYRRSPHPIPLWNDLDGMWLIYKNAYNSIKGAAQEDEFKSNCVHVMHYLEDFNP